MITEEDGLLKKAFHRVMKKQGSMQEFVLVHPGLFVYCCDAYIPMSSVTLTSLQRCGITFEFPTLGELEPCLNESYGFHDGYLPFFNDNNSLLCIYQKILQSPTEEDSRKMEVLNFQQSLNRVMRYKAHKSSAFHTNSLPTTMSWDLEENEWTIRLSKIPAKIPARERNPELLLSRWPNL